MFDRITFDPEILDGRACVRGLAISVFEITHLMDQGASAEQILQRYPELEAQDLSQAREYAAWLAQEELASI
jgi:uncharacterized protein (DUF433 family)